MGDQAKKIWRLIQNNTNNLKSLLPRLNDAEGKSPASAADNHAEEVMRYAEELAVRREQPVEQVLSDLGFVVDGSEPPKLERPLAVDEEASTTAGRSTMLRSLEWSEAPARRGSSLLRTPVELEAVVISALSMAVEKKDLFALLSGLAPGKGRIREKLLFVDAASAHAVERATRGTRKGEMWWRGLVQQGLPPNTLVEIIASEPYFPPIGSGKETFKEYLLDTEIVSWHAMQRALTSARAVETSYLAVLVQDGVIDDAHLYDAMTAFTGWPRLAPEVDRIDPAAAHGFPTGWCKMFEIIPISKTEEGTIVAAPFQLGGELKARLEAELGGPVIPHLADRATLGRLAVDLRETDRRETVAAGNRISQTPVSSRPSTPEPAPARQPPVIEVVRRLIEDAIDARATHIHVEPFGEEARVRYRVDGTLEGVVQLPGHVYRDVVAHLKVLSGLDASECRRPQDGHVSLRIRERNFELRFATAPMTSGEKLAVRLIESDKKALPLAELGLSETALNTVHETLRHKHGLILATGTIGSGLSTTLYGFLDAMDRQSTHVVSVEDPVEQMIEGVNQMQVSPLHRLTAVEGLRSLVRQDPDVIMVSALEDPETAQLATRSAMNGVLVLGALHAHDTIGAITALRHFGVPPHQLAGALVAVVSQRLVRRICEGCKEPVRRTKSETEKLGKKTLPAGFKLFRGAGCEKCKQTGYHGRLGIFEVLSVDDTLREMIREGATERTLREHATTQGLLPLTDDATQKIGLGMTTAEEAARILGI